MRIFSICVVKNEADIIELALRSALQWSDYIIIYDGASTDGTWEIIRSMNESRIICWKQDGKVFREYLRQEVFEAFKHMVKDGDWWCQFNADEFYIDSPKEFLGEIPSKYHVVWGIPVEYYITEKDVEQYQFTGNFSEDVSHLKYYKIYNAERRFFKHRKNLVWGEKDAWPLHLGIVYPKLIWFKHYPYRSPQQIQLRLDTRRNNRERGFEGWEHASQKSWKEKVEPSEKCSLETEGMPFAFNPSFLPVFKDGFMKHIIKYSMHHILKIWP
jgi:glycosyltransferase involved in cell wall biosynthesis